MKEILRNLDWTVLTDIFMNVIPALICITVHELCHGFAAWKLGVPTAKRAGRLTLNPLKHIDVMGLVMMAVFRFGWAKPVPVNMRYFKNPKRGMALTAFAGPLSNVVIACLFFFLYGLLFPFLTGKSVGEYLLQMAYMTGYLSVSLAVFNLLPIPPLDGAKVAFSLVSDRAYERLMRIERYGMMILAIIMVTGILSGPMRTAAEFCVDKLFVFARLGFRLAAGILPMGGNTP